MRMYIFNRLWLHWFVIPFVKYITMIFIILSNPLFALYLWNGKSRIPYLSCRKFSPLVWKAIQNKWQYDYIFFTLVSSTKFIIVQHILKIFRRVKFVKNGNKYCEIKGLHLNFLPNKCFFQFNYICFLTLSQTTNFRLFKTERVCRRQFQIWWKWQKFLQIGWKHCGKSNFSFLFPLCFQKTCTVDTKKPGFLWERVNTEVAFWK